MSKPAGPTNPWQPLPPGAIRLLELECTQAYTDPERGLLEAAIVCRLTTVSKADVDSGAITYGALSYVWGSSRVKRPLICNGYYKAITTNLYDALWQFLCPETEVPRYLWIDAVCINQDDDVEKSCQVSMMGDIYRNADKVLVWLGTCSSITTGHCEKFWDKMRARGPVDARQCLALDLDKSLTGKIFSAASQLLGNSGGLVFIPLAGSRSDLGEPATVPRYSHDLSNEERHAGAVFLSRSDWFHRVWTFQEIVLARDADVFCGPFQARFQDLVNEYSPTLRKSVPGSYSGQESRKTTPDVCNDILQDIEVARMSAKRMSLLQLFRATSTRAASDPRDRVHSVLGLYHGSQQIKPDYSASVIQTFARAALMVVAEESSLSCLDLRPRLDSCGLLLKVRGHSNLILSRNSTREEAISWIPTWSDVRSTASRPSSSLPPLSFPRLHPSFSMQVSLEGTSLRARGVILGSWTQRWEHLPIKPGINPGRRYLHRFPFCISSAVSGKTTEGDDYPKLYFRYRRKTPLFSNCEQIANMILEHDRQKCGCYYSRKVFDANSSVDEGDYAADERATPWVCVVFGTEVPLILQPIRALAGDKLKFRIRYGLEQSYVMRHTSTEGSTGMSDSSNTRTTLDDIEYLSRMFGASEHFDETGLEAKSPSFNWIPTEFEIVGELPPFTSC